MATLYQRAQEVLWNPVGRDPEELLLVLEGEETRIFVLSGRTGAALWTRLDGSRSVDDLCRELAGQAGVSPVEARAAIAPLVRSLREAHLVEPATCASPPPVHPLPWPEDLEPAALVPFSPEELAAPDLVAVGSFQGGFDNFSGQSTCKVGPGGFGNVGGNGPCRNGHGWGNEGNGPPCG